MEGLKVSSPLPQLIQRVLAEDKFTLIDIGCSSGIDDVWRVFSELLRAFAFIASMRLRAIQTRDTSGNLVHSWLRWATTGR